MATATAKRLTYRRPWLYDAQRDAIFHDERYGLIEASTKAGKTVACLVWIAEQAMQGSEGKNYWWVAPVYTQAKIAYRRLRRALPRELYTKNDTDLTVTLANGAVIWFKSAEKPDTLYGEDVYAAVIDEATRCREESWHAIRSTLTATRGPVRIIGNVKGRKNWAYQLARKAESGEPNMHYAKLTAYDAIQAGVLAEDEVEDAKRQLPENVFRELYLAEPSDDGGNPFGLSAIRACIRDGLAKGQAISWGWDLAKAMDYTVGIALNRKGEVCRFERFQRPWELTIATIGEVTGSVAAWVDSTGVGDPILERLQKTTGSFHGIKFTQALKQQLMEGLAVAIQSAHEPGKPHLMFPPGDIVRELETFEYELTRSGVRYTAPEGLHDDCVVALALALYGYKTAQHGLAAPVGIGRGGPSPWQ